MQKQNIEVPSKDLSAVERQWLMISILTQLAGVEAIDLGIGNIQTGAFWQKGLAALGVCDQPLDDGLKICRGMNSNKNENIYIRSARRFPASIAFQDDLTRTEAVEFAGNYNHLIVETSPNNTQVWVQTDKTLNEDERFIVQSCIQKKIGGDVGSTSGEHYGRLAGFKNHKRGGCWVNILQYRLDGNPMPVSDMLVSQPSQPSAPNPVSSASPLPKGGRVLESVDNEIELEAGDSQESHKEFKYACMSLEHGMGEEKIINNIAKRALMRGKRRTESAARRYAEITVENAKNRRAA